MAFPGQNPSLPIRPFPFDPSVPVLPTGIPDCHLVRTVIPCLPSYDSLGVFHDRMIRFLASFARMVSRSDNACCLATTIKRLSSFPTYSLKAGYTAHSTRFCAPPCRFIPGPYAKKASIQGVRKLRRTIPGLHGNRVVCSMPLERARDP